MLEVLDGDFFGDDFEGIRNRLIVETLYDTGMRRSELAGLKDSDVDMSAMLLKVTGKRNKQRLIPFAQRLKGQIEHYWEVRRRDVGETDGWLFVNANGQTISGYNTLDDVDWLAENYGISADTTETETNGLDATQFSEDLQAHVNFFNMYTEKSEMLKEEIKEGFSNIGLTEEQMDGISEATKKEADEEAKTFLASLDKKEEVNEDIAEDGTKGQTAEDNNVDVTEDATTPVPEDEDKLLEEELIVAA